MSLRARSAMNPETGVRRIKCRTRPWRGPGERECAAAPSPTISDLLLQLVDDVQLVRFDGLHLAGHRHELQVAVEGSAGHRDR